MRWTGHVRPRPLPVPLPHPVRAGRGLAYVAVAVARAGDVDQAEAIAGSITFPIVRAEALLSVAQVLTETGDVIRARQVIQQAEAIAGPVTDPAVEAAGAGECGGGTGAER